MGTIGTEGSLSEFITLGELIEQLKGKTVKIPLFQRNYKWEIENSNSSSNSSSALGLLKDILEICVKKEQDHTIGMIVLYKKDDVVQVIDGQQRLITLSLLAKALGRYDDFIQLTFGRDVKKERENFLKEKDVTDVTGVDVKHMEAAYKALKNNLAGNDFDKVYDKMLKHLKVIRRYTEDEPLQEFFNVNERKTAFSSTDYDRAYQIKYQSEKNGQEITD